VRDCHVDVGGIHRDKCHQQPAPRESP
jgi:hypothetical protein